MKTTLRLSIAAFGLAIFTVSTATVQAQFNYETNNGTITITKYTGPGGAVTIPSTINGLPVTSIGDRAFQHCTSLTSIAIPNSVTSIGEWAFHNCRSLTSITIPDSVTSIGDWAFESCTSLTSITIPDSVTSIGDCAFASCTSLTKMTIGNASVVLGRWVFWCCDSLPYARIGSGAMLLPGGRGSCEGSVTIQPTIDGLPVTHLGDELFSGCTSLTSVTIPDSVISIRELAFFGCTSLTSIAVDSANPNYSSLDGVLFNKSQTMLIQCPGRKAGSYSIPNSVTTIGGWAFDSCTSLTSVTIGNSVTSIGYGAFQNCTSLTSIMIPNSVTRIGDYAFVGCTSLTSVTIPNSVTNIGAAAFKGCTGLTSVEIPDSVTSLEGGWNGREDEALGAFAGCTSLTSVTIPNSVTSIGDCAFYYCTSLTNAYFAGNAPSLAKYVFDGSATTVYYLPGTIGWGSTFGNRPTAPWLLPYPVILTTPPSFGIQTNAFGFRISWVTNASVVVEASTTLANPVWSPVSTNALTAGWCDFSDAEWTNYPARFYRIRSLARTPDPTVAILRNFPDVEIDMMQQILSEMGLRSEVFDQEFLVFQDVQDSGLIIWDDLGFADGGLTGYDASVFQTAFESGIPLYFIGDDLAFASINLSPDSLNNWVKLLHLKLGEGGNGSDGNGVVTIVNTNHPVVNGAFGLVTNYSNFCDIDDAQRTGTGEVLLGTSGSADVLLAFEDPVRGTRSVTQNNCLLGDLDATPGEVQPDAQAERKRLFQNAVTWLLRR